MGRFISSPRSIRMYSRADCKQCDGLGLIASEKMPSSAGDTFRITVRFCDCTTLFTLQERDYAARSSSEEAP